MSVATSHQNHYNVKAVHRDFIGNVSLTSVLHFAAPCSAICTPRSHGGFTYEYQPQPILSRITIDPEICHGKPAIRRLRYPVESMLEYLAAGDTFQDLVSEFPDLEKEDLQACLEFAAQR